MVTFNDKLTNQGDLVSVERRPIRRFTFSVGAIIGGFGTGRWAMLNAWLVCSRTALLAALLGWLPMSAISSVVIIIDPGGGGDGGVTVVPPPTSLPVLAVAVVGEPFTQSFYSSSALSYAANNLPPGLAINATNGVVSGVPTTAGSFNTDITIVTGFGIGFLRGTFVVLEPGPPAVTNSASATAFVGQPFRFQVAAQNYPTNYTYAAAGLPNGLTLNSTNGLITGQPTAAGVSAVTLMVSNDRGTGSQAFTLTVALPPPPVITSPTQAVAVAGKPFAYQVTATNGPVSYGVSGLPVGLQVDAVTGLITGRPAGSGTNQVTLLASNAGGTGSQGLTLRVTPPPLDYLWIKPAGILGYFVRSHVVTADANGNIYLAGIVNNSVAADGSFTVAAGTQGPFVAKFNPAGTLMWMTVGAAQAGSGVTGAAVDASGRVTVTGYLAAGTLRWGTNELVTTASTKAFVANLEADGTPRWAWAPGGTDLSGGNSIAVDSLGQLYVAGYFRGTIGIGATSLASDGGFSDAFIAKLDADGSFLWVRRAGGSDWNPPNSLAVGGDRVYLAGSFQTSTAGFGSLTLTNVSVNRHGFLACLDNSGNYQWAKLVGASFEDSANAVTADASGNAYVAGAFRGTAVFSGTNLTNPSVYSRIYVAKYGSAGDFLWARQAEGVMSYHSGAGCLSARGSGGVLVGGNFAGTATFDLMGLTTSASYSTLSAGFVAELDASGRFLWARQVGYGQGDHVASVVAIPNSSDAAMTGYFYRTASFDGTTLTRTGEPIAFLARLGMLTNAPVITTQPSSTNVVRTNASAGPVDVFIVVMRRGDSVQWRFNGVPILGATNDTLTITDVQRTNAGTYSVEVSNPLGTNVSTNVSLRVLAPIRFLSPERPSSTPFRLRFTDNGVGGVLTTNEVGNFEVHVSTNLAGTNWLRLNVPLTVTNGQIVFEDMDASSSPRRFYRVLER